MADSANNSAMTVIVAIIAVAAIGFVAYFAMMAMGNGDADTMPNDINVDLDNPVPGDGE